MAADDQGASGAPARKPGKRALAMAEASLASLYDLRARFLPAACATLPADAAALADLIAGQRRAWIDQAYPPERLVPAIMASNIAAFLIHALDLANLPEDDRQASPASWFDDPASPLAGHARYDPARAGMMRMPCCLRDLVGVARCDTCPRSGTGGGK